LNRRIAAVPGQWYQDRGSGDMFQIVSVDEDDGSIDVQHTNGSLEEASVDDWRESTRAFIATRCGEPDTQSDLGLNRFGP
jgi:hypothetical protein